MNLEKQRENFKNHIAKFTDYGNSQSGYSQSASLLAHNRIAASQLIRSGLYHS